MRFLWLAALVACSTSPPEIIGVVPLRPDASTTTSDAVTTFAVDRVFLGDTSIDGTPLIDAWTQLGFDLDGLTTTTASTDVCTNPVPHAQVDGVNGIDNAWGQTILPLLQTAFFQQSVSEPSTTAIQQGKWTWIVEITGSSGDRNQSAIGLSGQVFIGAPLDTPPTFDATLDWPVRPSSLVDPTAIDSSQFQFTEVYVVDGTIVGRGSDQLLLPLWGLMPTLRVHHPVMAIHPDGTGILGGVLDPGELVAAFRVAEGNFFGPSCGEFDDTAQILAAQDILSDATNASGTPCNAISIGVRFTVKRVANPTQIGSDPKPLVDQCPDAGTD